MFIHKINLYIQELNKTVKEEPAKALSTNIEFDFLERKSWESNKNITDVKRYSHSKDIYEISIKLKIFLKIIKFCNLQNNQYSSRIHKRDDKYMESID